LNCGGLRNEGIQDSNGLGPVLRGAEPGQVHALSGGNRRSHGGWRT